MTTLTTKQFRAIVREEVAKVPGCSVYRSYTDNKQGPDSKLRNCVIGIITRGNPAARAAIYRAVCKRVAATGSNNLPTMPTFWYLPTTPTFWLRMTQLKLSPKQ